MEGLQPSGHTQAVWGQFDPWGVHAWASPSCRARAGTPPSCTPRPPEHRGLPRGGRGRWGGGKGQAGVWAAAGGGVRLGGRGEKAPRPRTHARPANVCVHVRAPGRPPRGLPGSWSRSSSRSRRGSRGGRRPRRRCPPEPPGLPRGGPPRRTWGWVCGRGCGGPKRSPPLGVRGSSRSRVSPTRRRHGLGRGLPRAPPRGAHRAPGGRAQALPRVWRPAPGSSRSRRGGSPGPRRRPPRAPPRSPARPRHCRRRGLAAGQTCWALCRGSTAQRRPWRRRGGLPRAPRWRRAPPGGRAGAAGARAQGVGRGQRRRSGARSRAGAGARGRRYGGR
jgi:hypothetical protein